jgi:hypothetical protein
MIFFYNDEDYFSLEQFMGGIVKELDSNPTDSLRNTILDNVNAYVFMNRLATISKDGCVSKYLKVNGYCRIELERIKNNPVPKVNLYICDESGVSNDYINYKVDSPIHMRDLKSVGALKMDSYRRYLNELGVTLGVKSIEGLMFADDRFPWFKKDKDSDLILKRIIDWYIDYFPDVNQESIFDIAERVQLFNFNRHEERVQSELPPELLIKKNAYDIGVAFNDTPVTAENIKRLKRLLPAAWRKALFDNSESIQVDKLSSFDDEDTPDNLYLALSAYKQIWHDFDSTKTNRPKKEDIESLIRKIGVTDNSDIQAIIRLIEPKEVKLGGRPNSNKEKWQPLCDRITPKVIN